MTALMQYDPKTNRDADLGDLSLRLSTEDHPPRLNVLVPHLRRDRVFGGLSSALELARHLAPAYAELRYLSLAPLPPTAICLDADALPQGCRQTTLAIDTLDGPSPVTFHRRDILLCTFWRTVLVWENLSRLLREAGGEPNPFYYFIQDWEPGFYPMGVKHALAEATYAHGERCLPIVNSRELARFLQEKNYHLVHPVVIKPSLNTFFLALFDRLSQRIPAKSPEHTTILVYGRPDHHRNCFPAVAAGLYAFANRHAGAAKRPLTFVSAGTAHEDIDFGHGVVLRSVGTLSLEDYAGLLLQSHVGLSLMASPHPSYPPLEMACFGLEVLTNTFCGKDLSRGHPRIHSVPLGDPNALADTLAQAIAAAEARTGRETPVVFPDALNRRSWRSNWQRAAVPVLSV